MKGMNINPTQAGFMLSSTLVGVVVGSILFGIISDRLGRRRTIGMCVGLFSLGIAATGSTWGALSFGGTRRTWSRRPPAAGSLWREFPYQRCASPAWTDPICLEQQEGRSLSGWPVKFGDWRQLGVVRRSAFCVQQRIARGAGQQRRTPAIVGRCRRLGHLRAADLSCASQRRPWHRHLCARFRGASRPQLVDLYADAGIEFIGLSEKRRPDDKFGIAAGYAHVSKRAQVLDADYRAFVRPNWPTRSFEGLLTAVYQYQIRDGWTVQPNFQYIIHPGGGAPFRLGRWPGSRSETHRVLVCGRP